MYLRAGIELCQICMPSVLTGTTHDLPANAVHDLCNHSPFRLLPCTSVTSHWSVLSPHSNTICQVILDTLRLADEKGLESF